MEKKRSFRIYAVEFFIACMLMLLIFIVRGKSLLRYCDGLNQYYYTLCYYGEWLREIFRNLFVEHRLQIPLWDMSIGYGADILTTLHYYGLGDPLNLLAVFVDREHMEYLFVFLVLLRLYVAGLGFMAFCRYHGCREDGARIAALVYCFSGWTILSGLRWAEFLTPLLFLPFLLLGIDRIYREKSPLLFSVGVGLAAASNFYFFYMICFFLLIYGIAAYFLYGMELRAGLVCQWFCRFTGHFLVGVGLTACIWLPVVLVLLGETRTTAAHYLPVLFPKAFYLSLPVNFVISSDVYNSISAGWGFAPVALTAVLLLFGEKKKHRVLKVLLVLSMVLFCVPYFCHVLNGFAYVAHRWAFASALVVSFCVARMWPEFLEISGKLKTLLLAAAVCYIPPVLYFMGVGLYGACTVVLVLASLAGPALLGKREKVLHGLLLLTVFAWVGVHTWRIYDCGDTYGYESFADVGTGADVIRSENPNLIRALQDPELYRYDSYGTDRYANWNLAMLLGIYGTQFYFSITDSVAFDYFQDLYLPVSSNYSYQNLDGRAAMATLASVKYFLVRAGEEHMLPYGFEKAVSETDKYTVYQNRFALPLGYTFDGAISPETWKAYSPAGKQYAMLQGCVTVTDHVPQIQPRLTDREAAFTISPEAEWTEAGYQMEMEAGGSIVLTLSEEILPQEEVYVELEGIAYLEENGVDASDLTVERGAMKKSYELRTRYAQGYCGIHNLMFQMGRGMEDGTIRITFEQAGTYRIRHLRVICQPLQEMETYISRLREDCLEETVISGNDVSGKLRLEKPEMLLISLPYNRGWTAYVDGIKTDIRKANGMFMALEVEAGEHVVELHYRTEGLIPGLAMAAVSLMILSVSYIKYRK